MVIIIRKSTTMYTHNTQLLNKETSTIGSEDEDVLFLMVGLNK